MASETPDRLEPDPQAARLADHLLADEDTQRTLLAETVAEDRARMLEAGRTVCGPDADPQPPRDRSATSVELEACDPGKQSGIYHTHPAPDQLANPDHSLPDLANVAFEGIDASVVVGAETSSVVVAAADRDAQRDAFRNAVGLDVDSTRGVVNALRSQQVPNPPAARQNVRLAFGPTVYRVETPHPDVLPESVVAADTSTPLELWAHYLGDDCEDAGGLRACRTLRDQGRRSSAVLGDMVVNTRVSDVVIGTVVGDLTSTLIESVLYD